MVGYPKMLNSKEDYEFVRKNFPKDEWRQDFQNLLDTEKAWFNMGKIPEGSSGTVDDTHRIVTDEQTGEKYQYEYKEDPDSPLHRSGYTEEEVKKILAEGDNG